MTLVDATGRAEIEARTTGVATIALASSDEDPQNPAVSSEQGQRRRTSSRRAFGLTALVAAAYFGSLAFVMEVLRQAEVDMAGSGWLLLVAAAVVVGGPLWFGWWIAQKLPLSSPKPVAIGALVGALVVFVVPTVVSVLMDPDGGASVAVIAAIFSLVVGWCVAVAAGGGAYLALRSQRT